MWTTLVIILPPDINGFPGVTDISELVLIQTFIAKASVKTLKKSVLRWCKRTRFSSTHFLRFPGFQPSAGILPASGFSGIHGGARCYIQPASAL
ncbi:hypothetical protein QE234_02690, partial [Klebsiella pneumoniae]